MGNEHTRVVVLSEKSDCPQRSSGWNVPVNDRQKALFVKKVETEKQNLKNIYI